MYVLTLCRDVVDDMFYHVKIPIIPEKANLWRLFVTIGWPFVAHI